MPPVWPQGSEKDNFYDGLCLVVAEIPTSEILILWLE